MPSEHTAGTDLHPLRRRLIEREISTGPDYWPADVRRGATTDEELFALFVGPNARKFSRTYDAVVDGTGRAWSMNWVVLFAALPWFFYRRMYLIGVAILVIPVMLALLFPLLAPVAGVGISVVMALQANRWYVTNAIGRIEKIKALGLPEEERNERIEDAGGVSPAGAAFGALIVVALASTPFLMRDAVALPGCDNSRVQELTRNMVQESLQSNGVRAMGLAVSEFKTVIATPDGSSNVCRFRARLSGEDFELYVGVSWQDRKTGEYQLRVGPTMSSVHP